MPQYDHESVLRHLTERVARHSVIPVVGAGASAWTTDGFPVTTWAGLIDHGFEFCATYGSESHPGVVPRKNPMRSPRDSGMEWIQAADDLSTAMDAPGGPMFAAWLRDAFAGLPARRRDLLSAIGAIGPLVLTTNYDDLIEHVLGLPSVTWQARKAVHRLIRGEDGGVLHLHGHWADPASVVFSSASYDKISQDPFIGAMLRAAAVMNSLLFMGFGAGLSDPHLTRVRRWLSTWAPHSPYAHFRLVQHSELADAQSVHGDDEGVKLVVYGESFGDLPKFLGEVAARSRTTKPAFTHIVTRSAPIRRRMLERLVVPLLFLSADKPYLQIAQLLCFTLLRRFAEKFESFTILYRTTVCEIEGFITDVPGVEFASHKWSVLSELRDEHAWQLEERARSEAGGNVEYAAFNARLKDRYEKVVSGWTIRHPISFSPRWQALGVEVDPEARMLVLQTVSAPTLNPADYPGGATRTSDLLCAVAAYYSSTGLHRVSLDAIESNHAMLPVLVDMMDRKFELAKVRVDADDDERWSYVNEDWAKETKVFL